MDENMPVAIVVRGEQTNLAIVRSQIEADGRLTGVRMTTVTAPEGAPGRLQHAMWMELLISVPVGLGTQVIYDIIKTLIKRARDRGPIEELSPPGPTTNPPPLDPDSGEGRAGSDDDTPRS